MSTTGLIQRISNHPEMSILLACSKLFLCVMPIAQIAVGVLYLDDCPRQRYIPIYLIVVGVFGLVLAGLSCLSFAQEPKDGSPGWDLLVSVFLFCWFITGNVWIYSIYEPNYNKNTTNVDPYCDKTLYLFAFWTTTLSYIIFGLLLVVGCCVLLYTFLCSRADPDDDV